jgi:hypothetical protein
MNKERPVPPQVSQWDFLLGDVHCVGSGDDPAVMTMRTVPMLNGHYLLSEGTGPGSQSVGRIFGWDPTAELLTEHFFSDMGGSGSSTSPGWREGELVVTGTFRFAGVGERTVRDVFRLTGEDEFTIEAQSLTDQEWVTVDRFSCRRKRTAG